MAHYSFDYIRENSRLKRHVFGAAERMGSCASRGPATRAQSPILVQNVGSKVLPATAGQQKSPVNGQSLAAANSAPPITKKTTAEIRPQPQQPPPVSPTPSPKNLKISEAKPGNSDSSMKQNGIGNVANESKEDKLLENGDVDDDSPLSGLLYNSLQNSESTRYAEKEILVEKMPAAGTPEASYACSVRLKKICRMVESDLINKEDLVKNLQYAVKVLEAVYVDETNGVIPLPIEDQSQPALQPSDVQSQSTALPSSNESTPTKKPSLVTQGRGLSTLLTPKEGDTRRLCNDDDDLPEVAPDAVPSEVRDWLASTFTRSQTSLKQNREKPRFRSVANAIRAGIMVERIYRRLSSSSCIAVPPNVVILLKAGLDKWCFDIFEVNEASDNHVLKYVGYELLHKYDLVSKFKINTTTLEAFLLRLEEGYSKWGNPYHNLVHGADVAQTCHHIMSSSKLVVSNLLQ